MDMRIPPLKIKILPESNPLKSRILIRRLAVGAGDGAGARVTAGSGVGAVVAGAKSLNIPEETPNPRRDSEKSVP